MLRIRGPLAQELLRRAATHDMSVEELVAELLTADLPTEDRVRVYLETAQHLLREAEEVGARIVDGLSMLIYQGAEAFKLWTGREPPINSMRRAALRVLRGENW